jgi:hypothetical protein
VWKYRYLSCSRAPEVLTCRHKLPFSRNDVIAKRMLVIYRLRYILYFKIFLRQYIKICAVPDRKKIEFNIDISRTASSGMLRRIALMRTDISEEISASIIRVTRIGELGTTLAVTNNRRTLS